MSIESSIDIKSLLKSMKKFPVNVQQNIMTGAVRAGAKPILTEARNGVPEKTKNLKKSLGIVKRRGDDKNITWFSVTPRKGGKYDGWYAHLVEFGHEIVGKDGKVKGFVAPVPFMRNAFDSQDEQSITAVKEYIAKRIPKEAAKSRVK